MKRILFYILLLSSISLKAQELESFKNRITIEGLKSGMKTISINHKKLSTVEAKKISLIFDSWLKLAKKSNNTTLQKKYSEQIKKLSEGFSNSFIFDYESDYPVNFCKNVDGSLCLSVSGFYSDNVYNSFRFNVRQIAGKEVQNIIIPNILTIEPNDFKEVKFWAFGSAILYKDFTEDGAFINSDYVIIKSSTINIKKLIDASITDEEFINKSELYLYTSKGLQKIKFEK